MKERLRRLLLGPRVESLKIEKEQDNKDREYVRAKQYEQVARIRRLREKLHLEEGPQ